MVDYRMRPSAGDREIVEAFRRGKRERLERAEPRDVRFDQTTGNLVVHFVNGASFSIPARSLQGLEKANDDELSDVRLRGETGVSWPRLDVDFSIAGLMCGELGTAEFMAPRRVLSYD